MELLFPQDEIGYGKECNNKNWATENHEYASYHICITSGNQADKNHVVVGGGGGKEMEKNKLLKVPTHNPKNSSTG